MGLKRGKENIILQKFWSGYSWEVFSCHPTNWKQYRQGTKLKNLFWSIYAWLQPFTKYTFFAKTGWKSKKGVSAIMRGVREWINPSNNCSPEQWMDLCLYQCANFTYETVATFTLPVFWGFWARIQWGLWLLSTWFEVNLGGWVFFKVCSLLPEADLKYVNQYKSTLTDHQGRKLLGLMILGNPKD